MRAVMLLLSIALAVIPLAGIAWILIAGSITTVDGMFMSLILLTISGIFLLDILLELRDRGLLSFLQKNKPAPTKESAASQGESPAYKSSPPEMPG